MLNRVFPLRIIIKTIGIKKSCSYNSTYTVHLFGFNMHYAYTFLPQTCTQVHVVLSEIESEPLVNYDDETESSEYGYEEDLSDTDPED